MRHIVVFFVFGFGFVFTLAAAAQTQPQISPGGVVNIASAAPDGLPNSGIAQGSIFMVSGTNLGAPNPNPFNPLQAATYPLPTSGGLNGTTIQFQAQGGQGPISAQGPVYAIMLYESPTMLAAILPSPTGTGNYTVTVTYNGQSSQPSTPVHVVTTAFGLFNLATVLGTPGYGYGPGAIYQVDSSGNFDSNYFGAPAMPGQTILLLGTGLGAVSGNESQGPGTGSVAGLVSLGAVIGNQQVGFNASVDYIGRFIDPNIGAYAGVDVIEVQIPQNVQGCFVSIAVAANGVVSNTTTISVDPSGTACSDSALGYSSADFQTLKTDQAARIGTIALNQYAVGEASGAIGRLDGAGATFVNLTANQFNSLPTSTVSVGGCIVATSNVNGPAPPASVQGTPLDAGQSINLSGPDGPIVVAQGMALAYSPVVSYTPLVDAGAFNLDNGGGGADVGAFQGSFTLPAAPVWTNAPAISLIGVATNANQTITWTGGDPNSVIQISGYSGDTKTGVVASFLCNAPSAAGQFTIPGYILTWLPTTSTSEGVMGVYTVGQVPFQAPNLEVGYATYTLGFIQAVGYTSGVGGVKEIRGGKLSPNFLLGPLWRRR